MAGPPAADMAGVLFPTFHIHIAEPAWFLGMRDDAEAACLLPHGGATPSGATMAREERNGTIQTGLECRPTLRASAAVRGGAVPILPGS